jgi:hypothetical protein
LGYTIDAWIEYHDAPRDSERADTPPFSSVMDNSIPLTDFVRFRYSKDYRLFAALSGIERRDDDPDALFRHRGDLPPNVSGYTKAATFDIEDADAFTWLTYPEIEQALAHMRVQRDELSLASNLVLDLMQSIEKRLGEGRSRLIFFIWY